MLKTRLTPSPTGSALPAEPATGRAVAASLAAGSAYLAAMWLDMKVSSHPFNDLKLLGQFLPSTTPVWLPVGLGAHYSFSIVMGLLYAKWVHRRLPGPGWLKGVLFLQLENTLLYPAAALMEPMHDGVKSGQVPTLFSWKTFWGQVLRHIAFGVTLGAIYRPKR